MGAGRRHRIVFELKNGQKDVRYYTPLADAVGSTAFLGGTVHQIHTFAAPQGDGARGPSTSRCFRREH
jgi:3-hydroxyisobutyrate dehydrogenase-like beta-hydroxyacid dehydrogenase